MATLSFNAHFGNTDSGSTTIFWAVVASIAVHILIAYILPGINFEELKSRVVMSVELAPPALPNQPTPIEKAEPQPVTPPTPQIKKQEPVVKPVTVKPDIRPVLPPMPSPIAEPSAISAPVSEAKPQPPVSFNSESSEDNKPVVTPSQQAKPIGSTSPDVSDARNQYGDMLARHIDKFKQYPRIAQMRNWEGDVLLELQLDADGNLTSTRIYKSSGKESLDNQALEMVKKASPFPMAPSSLRGRSFTIMVPVKFRLDQ